MRGTTARGHKRARDKVRARARARARAFGRSTNCFGRGLTSSTRGEFRRRTPSCILLGKVSKHIRWRSWSNAPPKSNKRSDTAEQEQKQPERLTLELRANKAHALRAVINAHKKYFTQ